METTERTKKHGTMSGLPPEDLAFLSGVLQALTAMYCRLHPIQEEQKANHEPKKEET